MPNNDCNSELTRRHLLQLGLGSAALLGTQAVLPFLAVAEPPAAQSPEQSLYTKTLQSWCDGLLAHQISLPDPALHGAILCPACGLIHGRCGDAVYPLLRVAHTTGNPKYLHAAVDVHNWSERNVSREDGSWVNDLTLSTWKGITVFKTIALTEALLHHGSLLPSTTRKQWTDRVARAAKFLDGFITLQTGNINYPITSTAAFALCAQLLNEPRYLDRARTLAHEALANFTPAGLLFGEGHPFDVTSPKGCHPVDLGYNVEESLPALALYITLAAKMGKPDPEVEATVLKSLRTHLEFMLPDGGWDNSWGTRNYKWSYWGSRTSDGCQPAFMLMADRSPQDAAVFREAAHRNLKLMADCTHNNLLYGGPDYFAHGDQACIHHGFTHAKALATTLDRASFPPHPVSSLERSTGVALIRTELPRDQAYGLKSFPDIATRLASIGPWRATVTANDWEYIETVQTGGGGNTGGGHASGGALSMLYHETLGPILCASMNQYSLVEISNQQQFTDKPHMTLTPRIECTHEGKTYTSLVDLKAKLTTFNDPDQTSFTAEGFLQTTAHQPGEGIMYKLIYRIHADSVTMIARASGNPSSGARFIFPVVSHSNERVEFENQNRVVIEKMGGKLAVETDAPQGFETIPNERTFNLVPGFECISLSVQLQSGPEYRVTFRSL